jgi:Ca-activated chloride channel family protein
MKYTLLAVALIVLALGACMARNPNGYRTAGAPRDADACDMVIAGHESVDGLKPIAAVPEEQGDRDLGTGADDEKLGNPQRWRGDVDPQTGERYAPVVDNPFVRTTAPGGDASTFGLDVDSASYANCRRFISEMKRLPPPGAVRIEELVNTLAYAYPAPAATSDVPFRTSTAVAACPWAPEHRLVRVALRARAVDPSSRPPLNLVFLVDVSGSMSDANKLPLVRESLLLLAEHLTARDRLAIVTYAGRAGTLLPATAGDQQERIRTAIRSLTSGGSTNGAGGIEAAYAEAGRGVAPGTVSRVMLCTDGDFNVGISDRGQLQALVERQRAGGVCLNAYGFGMGNYKDDTLETLADHGNGIYGYIDSMGEARRLFAREAMGQLVTVAKDAKVQVFFNPAAVGAWRLLGYENRVLKREDFNDDRVDAGDIGAGHTVTALYEVVPAGAAMPVAGGGDANPFLATPAASGDASTLLRLRLRWKDPEAAESRLLEHDVPATPSEMDADFRTAAAAAGFGMLLRHSPWRGACTWDLVARLAESGRGADATGQRAEFAKLIAGARYLR